MTRANWAKVGIVAAAVLVVSTVAFADQSFDTAHKPGVGLKEIYNRNVFFSGVEGTPVQLPRPVGDFSVNGRAVSGPIASGVESPEVGSAIAQARGGSSMYSQKQLADQEIGRLIRRLD